MKTSGEAKPIPADHSYLSDVLYRTAFGPFRRAPKDPGGPQRRHASVRDKLTATPAATHTHGRAPSLLTTDHTNELGTHPGSLTPGCEFVLAFFYSTLYFEHFATF